MGVGSEYADSEARGQKLPFFAQEPLTPSIKKRDVDTVEIEFSTHYKPVLLLRKWLAFSLARETIVLF